MKDNINSEGQTWYIHVDGEAKGPLGIRDLDVLIRTNEINSKTLGWKTGMKQWKPLIEIEQMRQSILQSSKEIMEIKQKKTSMFDQKKSKFSAKEEEKAQGEQTKEGEQADKVEGEEDPMAVIASTVENLVKNSFHQSEDGKWNIYDQTKKEWFTQTEQPKQQIEALKNALLQKLKTQLFSKKKEPKRRRQAPEAVPQILTKEELQKRERNRKKTKRAAEKKKQKWYNPKINTFVYINGLPPDITQQQLKEFASKAGVIRIDLQTGTDKIKLYRNDDGQPKGDAVISYAKQESIGIALEMLNQRQIKPGFPIRIERAQFNQKNQEYKPRDSKKQSKINKIIAKKNEERQLDWGDQQIGEGLKIVILKHMFTPQMLGNQELLQQMKEDIENQCKKMGEIQRIRFYQTHPQGVVEVKFKEDLAAEQCIQRMNGRFFDGRQIQCFYWDGQTNYKTAVGTQIIESGRIEQFGDWIQGMQTAINAGGQIPGIKVIQLTLEDLQKDQPVPTAPQQLTAKPQQSTGDLESKQK